MLTALLYCDLRQGKHDRGAHHRRFEEQLKRHLTQADVDHRRCEELAEDRLGWVAATKSAGGDNFEEK